MAHHTAQYGRINHDLYYVILRELYDTYQRSIMFQNDIEAIYNEIDNYFTDVLLDSLIDNYNDTANNFQDSFNSFADSTDTAARFEHLSNLNLQLLDFLNMYRNNLTRTASLLEQVQRINPDFTLHIHPYNLTITVSPVNWLVIEAFNPGFDWNPEIFNFETLSQMDKEMIRVVGNTSISGPDFWEIVTAFNTQSNRQTRTITFSLGESPYVFNTERIHPLRLYTDRASYDDKETESDIGENSEDEEAEPQPQGEDVVREDL